MISNETIGLLWVVMIASASNEAWPDDILFDIDQVGPTTELVFRVTKLATIENDRVLRSIGVAGKKVKEAYSKALRAFTG